MSLSKKHENRLKDVLRKSKVDVFNEDSSVTPMIEMFDSLSDNFDQFQPKTQKLLEIFLRDKKNDKMFLSVDYDGINHLSRYISAQKAMTDVSLNVFFGGTERMPLRSLSYLLPALHLANDLSNLPIDNSTPEINFSFMNSAAAIINNYDADRLDDASSQLISLADKYIKTFYPAIRDKVHFLSDSNFTENIFNGSEFELAQSILQTELEFNPNIKNKLLQFGERRNSSENSLAYAALHIFAQDGIIDPSVACMEDISNHQPKTETGLSINIGAKPEETFFHIRKMGAEKIARSVAHFCLSDTLQYIVDIGVPPYSPLATGELYLDEALDSPCLVDEARLRDRRTSVKSRFQTPVQKAVEALDKDIADTSLGETNLKNFLKTYQ